MIKNAEKCVFVNADKAKDAPENAIMDAAIDLRPGKTLVYQLGQHGMFQREKHSRDPVKLAAANVAAKLKLALVQWPNGPASDGNRTWCFGMQKHIVVE